MLILNQADPSTRILSPCAGWIGRARWSFKALSARTALPSAPMAAFGILFSSQAKRPNCCPLGSRPTVSRLLKTNKAAWWSLPQMGCACKPLCSNWRHSMMPAHIGIRRLAACGARPWLCRCPALRMRWRSHRCAVRVPVLPCMWALCWCVSANLKLSILNWWSRAGRMMAFNCAMCTVRTMLGLTLGMNCSVSYADWCKSRRTRLFARCNSAQRRLRFLNPAIERPSRVCGLRSARPSLCLSLRRASSLACRGPC
jgi:hypothetical protein